MWLPVLAALGAGILLAGVWFGGVCGVQALFRKLHMERACRFSTAVAAAIPAILVLLWNGRCFLNAKGALDGIAWLVLAGTVLLTSWIVSANPAEPFPNRAALLRYGLDGALMEVPQRLMMQPFVWVLLETLGAKDAAWIAVPVTAAVWCGGILAQNAVTKQKCTRRTVVELAASAVFSLGIGVVLVRTEWIALPMLAHFSERLLSTALRRRRCGAKA